MKDRRKQCMVQGCSNYRHYGGVCKEHFQYSTYKSTPRYILYNAWFNMKARCQGKHNGAQSYPDRGIDYAQAWETFQGFLADMESTWRLGLTLERKDNDKGYSKENCIWATRAQQARNTKLNR